MPLKLVWQYTERLGQHAPKIDDHGFVVVWMLETLGKYGKYICSGWGEDTIGVIQTTIEVCKQAELEPFVLCEVGSTYLWRMMLNANPKPLLFNNANTCNRSEFSHDGFLMLKDGCYEPTPKFKEAQVLFVFNVSYYSLISKKMHAIMCGVMRYNKKFCVISVSTAHGSEMLYNICMSNYNSVLGNRKARYAHDIAAMMEELEKCGCDGDDVSRGMKTHEDFGALPDTMRLLWNMIPKEHLTHSSVTELHPARFTVEKYSLEGVLVCVPGYGDAWLAKAVYDVIDDIADKVVLIVNSDRAVLKSITNIADSTGAVVGCTQDRFSCAVTKFVTDPSCRLMVASDQVCFSSYVFAAMGDVTVITNDVTEYYTRQLSAIIPRTGNVRMCHL